MPAKKTSSRRTATKRKTVPDNSQYSLPQYQHQPQPYYPRQQGGNQAVIAVLAALLIITLLIVCVLCYIFLIKPKLAGAPNKSTDESEQNSDALAEPSNYQIPLGVQMPSAPEATQDNSPTADWQSYTWLMTPKASTSNSSSSSSTATTTGKSAPTSTLELKYPDGWSLTKSNNTIKLTNKQFADAQIVITSDYNDKKLTDFLKALDEVAATAYEGKPSVQVKSQNALGTNSEKISAIQRMQYLTAADLQEKITYISYQGQVISVGLIAPKLTDEMSQIYDLMLTSFKLN